ncbi:DUF3545 family protein [Shewanella intestini]|uniref:DUF3545 family protein n=1 Tax=Shewanella intestini TaxID=2017544 RepID=A0ABS5HY22_9GAMM|nr:MULTISPECIES: DUF3545 family protein [Shewanella]MBR9726677.1 DUF3545 family protein [Shewanella intestini]MRG34757.1 DUF3545 family protein [Shewanella sp. XMDDZSB0408]
MDRLDYGGALEEVVEKPTRTRSSSKKRKWREIEAIKDKQRLLKELQDIDNSFELDANMLM